MDRPHVNTKSRRYKSLQANTDAYYIGRYRYMERDTTNLFVLILVTLLALLPLSLAALP